MINFVIILLVCQLEQILCYKINDLTETKVVNLTKVQYPNEPHRFRLPVRLLTITDQGATPYAHTAPLKKTFAYDYSNAKADLRNGRLHQKSKRTVGEIGDKLPNYLRLYFCGTGYQNCMYDDRLNSVRVQHDFLKQIPRMADITLPSETIDWKSKQLHIPANSDIWNNMNLSGRREQFLSAEEPHYIILRSDGETPQHLALLSGPDYTDDPFIPQRGRRFHHPHISSNTNNKLSMIKSFRSPLIGSLTASDIRYGEFDSPTVRKKRNASKQREINVDVLNAIDNGDGGGGGGGGESMATKSWDMESTRKSILGQLNNVYRSKFDKSHILPQNLNELLDESRWQQLKLVAQPQIEPLMEPYTVPLIVAGTAQRDKLKWENPFFKPSSVVYNRKSQKPSNDYSIIDDRQFYIDGGDFGKKPLSSSYSTEKFDDENVPRSVNTIWQNSQPWLYNLSPQNRDISYSSHVGGEHYNLV